MPDQVQPLRQHFGLQRLVLVGDRGMLTDTQIETLRDYPGLGWISALRHHDIRRLAQEGSVQMSLFDERNLAEIHSPLYPHERLIVCCNPALAERRRHKREALLEAAVECHIVSARILRIISAPAGHSTSSGSRTAADARGAGGSGWDASRLRGG